MCVSTFSDGGTLRCRTPSAPEFAGKKIDFKVVVQGIYEVTCWMGGGICSYEYWSIEKSPKVLIPLFKYDRVKGGD